MNIEGVQQIHHPMELTNLLEPPQGQETRESRPDPEPAQTQGTRSVIQFESDQVSGKMMMQVVDPESGEVVRQIPPEEMVAISRVLGLLFDQVA